MSTAADRPVASIASPAGTKWLLPYWQRVVLVALPVAAPIYAWGLAKGVTPRVEAVPAPVVAAASPPNGPQLYARNCARCHGARGEADGPTSPYLEPVARKFGDEKFQFISATNGVPTDADLDQVIRYGIPSTAMPAFEDLTKEERDAIAAHVRRLARAGLYGKIWRRDPEELDALEASNMVAKQMQPGEAISIPSDLPAMNSESIARGQKTFTANCATCHGPKGAGDGPQVKDMKNDNGQPTRPRDLARGVFKGGSDPHHLYARIALGLPGTPMPASASLKPNEIGDLVNFVLSLSADKNGVVR